MIALPSPLPSASHSAQLPGQSHDIYSSSFSSLSRMFLSRTFSRILLRSVSTDSFLQHHPDQIDPTIPLHSLLDVIKRHPSLQDARIVQADSYRRAKLPRHRFIILQLEREGRDQIWLRIDRRRDKTRGFANFALNAGTSPANDRVSC